MCITILAREYSEIMETPYRELETHQLETHLGRQARLGRAWGPVIGRSASGASPGRCQGASHDFCAASLGLRIAEAAGHSLPRARG